MCSLFIDLLLRKNLLATEVLFFFFSNGKWKVILVAMPLTSYIKSLKAVFC